MRKFTASNSEYSTILSKNEGLAKYPLLRNNHGLEIMYSVSPIHGRSFIVKERSQKDWVISKGNGLCYSSQSFLVSDMSDENIWGALSLSAALRDFKLGEEVSALGIKTNKMEHVLELETLVGTGNKQFKAALLQYSVECPYRICDIAFAPRSTIEAAIKGWQSNRMYNYNYLKAADILVENLYKLHSNKIMHNAMHAQNYTWALELLDFESARSDNMPYDNPDYEKFVPLLINAEIIQTYEIINYIAWCLGEPIDYFAIDDIYHYYGFNLWKSKEI